MTAAVRTPPRPPHERDPGRCNLCGTPPEGRRRTWCSDECVTLWFLMTSGRHAFMHHRALHGHECWRCGARTETARQPSWSRLAGEEYEVPVTLDVDHVRPLWSLRASDRRSFRWWTPANLQLLCRSCHAAKTAHEARLRARARREGVEPAAVWLGWRRLADMGAA